MDVEQARSIAEELLAEPLPQRWAHSAGVVRRAREFAELAGDGAELLEMAAWLHDIGYSPAIAHSGFHPMDGARYLRDVVGAPREVVELVAHHSGASFEAEERGLVGQFRQEFPEASRGALLQLLTACDMSTSPDGALAEPADRVNEILYRYPAESPVYRAVSRSRELLVAQARGSATGDPALDR